MRGSNYQKRATMYHGQAKVDRWAKYPEDGLSGKIIETTMRAILEAHDEFMQDLLAESQEAY